MKIVLMFVAMISCTVAANLLLKTGAVTGDSGREGLAHLLNWRVMLGLVVFGLAAAFYLLILQWLPLNVAQSFSSIAKLTITSIEIELSISCWSVFCRQSWMSFGSAGGAPIASIFVFPPRSLMNLMNLNICCRSSFMCL